MFAWLVSSSPCAKKGRTKRRDPAPAEGRAPRDDSSGQWWWRRVGLTLAGVAVVGTAGYLVRRTIAARPPPETPPGTRSAPRGNRAPTTRDPRRAACDGHTHGSDDEGRTPAETGALLARHPPPGAPRGAGANRGDHAESPGANSGRPLPPAISPAPVIPDWTPDQWCDCIRDSLSRYFLAPELAQQRLEEANELLSHSAFMGFKARLGDLCLSPGDAPTVTWLKIQDTTSRDVNFLVRLQWDTLPRTSCTIDVCHNWMSMRQSTQISEICLSCEADVVAEATATPGGGFEVTLELLCEKVELEYKTSPEMDPGIYSMLRDTMLEMLEGGVVNVTATVPP